MCHSACAAWGGCDEGHGANGVMGNLMATSEAAMPGRNAEAGDITDFGCLSSVGRGFAA
jgi:hypothetical protein